MISRPAVAALAAIGLAAGLAARGETAPASGALETFQRLDTRLFVVGWKLARANAPYCENTAPAIGLLLHDAAAYGEPGAVRRTFGLTGDIGVQAVAPGSPADAAGLAANDTLIALGRETIAEAYPRSDPAWKRNAALAKNIDAALVEGPVTLAWTHPGGSPARAAIAGAPACAVKFEVLDSSNDASADATRVLLGRNFPAFAWPEDEFAAAIAHEMAHILLGHLDTFETTGRERRLVRLSERDADRLMPWLLQNAGYDPQAAVRFMAKWGPRYGGWLFRKRTHDGWDERVEFIEAEIAAMQPYIAADGSADWSRHFRRELATELAAEAGE